MNFKVNLRKLLSIRRKLKEEVEGVEETEGEYESLEEAMEHNPHLKKYVDELDDKPVYVKDLDLSMRMKKVNVIYPLKKKVFIHVNGWKYSVVEPPRPDEEVLDSIGDYVAVEIGYRNFSNGDVRSILDRLVEKGIRKYRKKYNITDDFIVRYHFLRDRIGLGFLEPFLMDKWIEDIAFTGTGRIFIYHKLFQRMDTNITLDPEYIDKYLRRIAERYGKKISYSNPIIDIYLPDGSRFNVVYGSDISLKGSNFTIRKFPEIPYAITDLINFDTLSPEIAAYIWMMIEAGSSILFCGETASGKTTTLTASLEFIPLNYRIVTIEEAPEVYVTHPNWVREVVRLHGEAKVDMFDLVKAALRQRPDYLIVGEIRGREGQVLMQAIETGHPALSTMHASNVKSMVQRLTSNPINVPRTHVDNINVAVFQTKVYAEGHEERRVTEVDEIIGYDADRDRVNYMPVFTYDPSFGWRFVGSSYHLENKYAKAMEIDPKESYEILREKADFISSYSEKHLNYFQFLNALRR